MPIDREEIPDVILERLPEPEELLIPGSGCTSEVLLLRNRKKKLELVLKRSRGEQFRQWLRREFEVLGALRAASLPIPKAYQFVSEEKQDASWLLMEYREGRPLTELLLEADEAGRERLFALFGETLRRLHQTPAPDDLRRLSASDWLERMLEEAAFNLEHYSVDGDQELLSRLQQRRPPPVAPRLIHGDFTTDNVLLAEGGAVSIIDWSRGSLGDPRYDIALALTTEPEIPLSAQSRQAFFRGYGATPVSAEELGYFVDLYEFF